MPHTHGWKTGSEWAATCREGTVWHVIECLRVNTHTSTAGIAVVQARVVEVKIGQTVKCGKEEVLVGGNGSCQNCFCVAHLMSILSKFNMFLVRPQCILV